MNFEISNYKDIYMSDDYTTVIISFENLMVKIVNVKPYVVTSYIEENIIKYYSRDYDYINEYDVKIYFDDKKMLDVFMKDYAYKIIDITYDQLSKFKHDMNIKHDSKFRFYAYTYEDNIITSRYFTVTNDYVDNLVYEPLIDNITEVIDMEYITYITPDIYIPSKDPISDKSLKIVTKYQRDKYYNITLENGDNLKKLSNCSKYNKTYLYHDDDNSKDSYIGYISKNDKELIKQCMLLNKDITKRHIIYNGYLKEFYDKYGICKY